MRQQPVLIPFEPVTNLLNLVFDCLPVKCPKIAFVPGIRRNEKPLLKLESLFSQGVDDPGPKLRCFRGAMPRRLFHYYPGSRCART